MYIIVLIDGFVAANHDGVFKIDLTVKKTLI